MMASFATVSAAFPDADGITYTTAVDALTSLDVIGGYADGTFRPTNLVTRGAFAKMVAYVMNGGKNAAASYGTSAALAFSDVDAAGATTPSVGYVVSKGIVDGYPDGTFRPSNNVTGVAAAKILLGALGYKSDIEGYANNANWKQNVLNDGEDAGLFNGMTTVDLSQNLTREQAAQMIWNALNAKTVTYTNPGFSITTGDTTVNVGSSEATVHATETMVKKYYKMYIATDPTTVDTYARPTVTYALSTDGANYNPLTDILAVEDVAAVKVYTEGFNAAEVRALAAANVDVDDNIYINGVDGSTLVDGTISTVADLADREYVGGTVELYSIDNNPKTIEKVVVTNSYLTKVTNIVNGYQTATSNYLTLEVYNPFAAGDVVNVTIRDTSSTTIPSTYDALVAAYAKDSYLLTDWYGGNVTTDETYLLGDSNVGSFTGTVTSTKYDASNFSGTFVSGGKTYTFATNYAEKATVGGNLYFNTNYTFYTDANGYVVGAVADSLPQAATNYGVVLDYQWANGVAASNMTGAPGAAAYEKVQIYTSEGKVEIFDTAFTLKTDGITIEDLIATDLTDNAQNTINENGVLVSYELNAAGKITKITKATDTAALATHATKGTTFEIVSGGAKDYATSGTVTFVMKNSGNITGVNDIVVYTGYANVPAYTYTSGKAIAAAPGAAGAVSVTVTTLPGAGSTAAKYIVLTDAAPSVTAGAVEGTYTYTWNAILDGAPTTVFYVGTSDTISSTYAKKLCTVTFDNATGAIADMSVVGVADFVTGVADGYYTAYNSNGTIVYTDASTAYYQLTADSIVASTISGINGYVATSTMPYPAAGETFQVYEYLTADVDNDNIVDVVFYFVYQP